MFFITWEFEGSFDQKHEQTSSSSITILSSGVDYSSDLEEKILKEKKKRSNKRKK